ncbi:protein SIP5-like, partial [Asparagus officinalis]|uniref:protein SIP5-like n=1 Tax=Asparagus officinalis TaxID=4686 RepID=UPI00098E21D9
AVDYKKLRKLILAKKLAPCFDAVEDSQIDGDLEECPICFLYYPSLNRSRCCAKGICTECFLQMKPSHASRPAQCPFCKTSCYAVEYHGARTEEEKGLEQAEEQKVIEAKIRMQMEPQIEQRLVHVNQHQTLSEIIHSCHDVGSPSSDQDEEREITQVGRSGLQDRVDTDWASNRNVGPTRYEVNVDLEEIMVMEAIWKSLQDSSLLRSESSEISNQNHTENPLDSSSSSYNHGDSFSPFGRRARTIDSRMRILLNESNSTQPETVCLSN